MKTIEEIYADMFEEHENIMAARRYERIRAANPYGCNQYGEGWKAPHNGKQSKAGEPAKKDSGEGKKKEPEKPEQKEEEDDEFADWPTNGKKFEDWKNEMESAVYNALYQQEVNGYVQGVFFDGYEFSTHDKDGRAVMVLGPDDIEELIKEGEANGVDDREQLAKDFVEWSGREVFEQIDFDDLKENLKHYKQKKVPRWK